MNVEEILSQLLGPEADPVAAAYRLKELAGGDAATGIQILSQLAVRSAVLSKSDPAIVGTLLGITHTLLIQPSESGPSRIGDLRGEVLAGIDRSLPENTSNRHLLLHLLAIARTPETLSALVARLSVKPPTQWMQGAQILSPLMQHDDWSVETVFPAMLECLSEPSLAASILDLANFLVRSNRLEDHPAADRVETLNMLLGGLALRLGSFEENPRSFGDDLQTVQERLSESVALAVSLCDALAIIGDPSSIGKLNQTLELKHRRVQCEAAGALAKFDDEAGKKRLIELAEQPAARLRAIHYADELGLGDQIDDELRSDRKTAEAEMALWLSQPHQAGLPPTHVEVLETRRLLWPSFDNPIDVTLVRFEYNSGDRLYSNVGLTGPTTFAMGCDLADLPVDDIFAIYAGWHAEHPDIFAVPRDAMNEAQLRVMETYGQHLQHMGYDDIKPELLGLFLDERAGVFSATREETQCIVVTDGLETMDQATASRTRAMQPEDAFNLFKGRKMLRTFNA
ncbi:MAG: HEAT repeat domain-containing protein [Planctomycetota bacterium]